MLTADKVSFTEMPARYGETRVRCEAIARSDAIISHNLASQPGTLDHCKARAYRAVHHAIYGEVFDRVQELQKLVLYGDEFQRFELADKFDELLKMLTP